MNCNNQITYSTDALNQGFVDMTELENSEMENYFLEISESNMCSSPASLMRCEQSVSFFNHSPESFKNIHNRSQFQNLPNFIDTTSYYCNSKLFLRPDNFSVDMQQQYVTSNGSDIIMDELKDNSFVDQPEVGPSVEENTKPAKSSCSQLIKSIASKVLNKIKRKSTKQVYVTCTAPEVIEPLKESFSDMLEVDQPAQIYKNQRRTSSNWINKRNQLSSNIDYSDRFNQFGDIIYYYV